MTTAYVLVSCEPGSEFQMLKELSRIPEVVEAMVTYGMYDIICKLDATSLASLRDIIVNDIRVIKKIKETQTLPFFHGT